MKYLSVCSGIEAASKAWEPIGWEPVAFSEIEAFPSAVLKHHWPKVQNLGDMTQHEQWNIPSGTIDLLVGGTPCQSFSVAGLRQGLKDPRGNLMLTYLAIAERLKPRWLVWENVPGVLSSNGGKDFGSFLGALGELGYEWAYRVLDAQWFGVAQRRRRVFVVAHLGEGSLAAKVLFESESVRRDNAPSRETRQGAAANAQAGVGVSPTITQCKGSRGGCSDEALMEIKAVHEAITKKWPADIASTLNAAFGSKQGLEDQHALGGAPLFVPGVICASDGQANASINKDIAPTLTKQTEQPYVYTPSSHAGYKEGIGTLRSNGGDIGGGSENLAVLYENHPNDSRVTGPHDVAPSCVSRYGTGGGNVPLVQEAVIFQTSELRLTGKITEQTVCPTLKANTKAGDTEPKVIAFEPGIATREGKEGRFVKELSPTLRKDMGDNQVAVAFPIDTQNMTEGHASGGKGHGNSGDPSFTLTKGHSHAVAVDIYNQAVGVKSQTLRSGASSIEHSGGVINPADRMAVRRLTPRECERLQGFLDDHTLIPWRNKPADQCPDGPRYKALGNSMAVPCMAWIGKRIDAVEKAK